MLIDALEQGDELRFGRVVEDLEGETFGGHRQQSLLGDIH
jgi:hypothetical protein